MSDLNVAIPAPAFTVVDKESAIQQAEQKNVVPQNQESKLVADEDTEEKQPQLSPTEVTDTVNEMNSFLQSMNRNLSFSIDEQLGQSVIIVKDSESEEIIRQIPSEELVVLRKKMDDVVGILFDTKV